MSTFTNNPSGRGKSRIVHDIKNINTDRENLGDTEGVYFKFNVSDTLFSTKYDMLLTGPVDSPYTGGFYIFSAQFPDQYPYRPMQMKSLTQGGKIRKHPNLYISGKCCFSFLGTWNGPPWTACQNPTTVAISMRSVLTNNPITNEPGWEKKNNPSTKLYENLVRYFNIRYAVIHISESKFKFKEFGEAIKKVFVKNFDVYKEEVLKIAHLDKKHVKSPVYNFSVYVDCTDLNMRLDKLYLEFNPQEKLVNILNTNSTDSETNETKAAKKHIRKCPVNPAINYPENTIMDGLDGRKWKVRKYSESKKRWVLNK